MAQTTNLLWQIPRERDSCCSDQMPSALHTYIRKAAEAVGGETKVGQ